MGLEQIITQTDEVFVQSIGKQEINFNPKCANLLVGAWLSAIILFTYTTCWKSKCEHKVYFLYIPR